MTALTAVSIYRIVMADCLILVWFTPTGVPAHVELYGYN